MQCIHKYFIFHLHFQYIFVSLIKIYVRFTFPLAHSSWQKALIFANVFKVLTNAYCTYLKEDDAQVLDSIREKTVHSIIVFHCSHLNFLYSVCFEQGVR